MVAAAIYDPVRQSRVALIVAIDVAKAFGQSAVFGIVLLLLLGGVGYLVLGFGNYRYLGPAGLSARAAVA